MTAALALNSRAELNIKELQELYVANETAPEVLRVEIDHLKDVVSRLEVLHKDDTSELTKSVHEAVSRIDAALALIEKDVAAVYGDRDRPDDVGLSGRNASSLKKVWQRIDKDSTERAEADKLATNERWKLRLAMAGYGGGSAAGIIGALKAMGII